MGHAVNSWLSKGMVMQLLVPFHTLHERDIAESTHVILSISLFITHYWLFKAKASISSDVQEFTPEKAPRKRRPQKPRENGNFQLRKRVSTGTQNSGTFSPPMKKTCTYVYILLPSLSSAELLNLFEVSPKSSSSFYAVYKLWKIWVCFRIIFQCPTKMLVFVPS